MAMICICGICIPYSSLLPILIVIFQPIWSQISKYMGWDKKQKAEKAMEMSQDTCCTDKNATSQPKDDKSADSEPKRDLSAEYFSDNNSIEFKQHMNWQDIVASNTYTVFKFTANWCKPCKRMQPVFEELASTHKNMRFVTFDVDEHEELFHSFGIVGIPHVSIYRAGVVVDTIKGENPGGLTELIVKCGTV